MTTGRLPAPSPKGDGRRRRRDRRTGQSRTKVLLLHNAAPLGVGDLDLGGPESEAADPERTARASGDAGRSSLSLRCPHWLCFMTTTTPRTTALAIAVSRAEGTASTIAPGERRTSSTSASSISKVPARETGCGRTKTSTSSPRCNVEGKRAPPGPSSTAAVSVRRLGSICGPTSELSVGLPAATAWSVYRPDTWSIDLNAPAGAVPPCACCLRSDRLILVLR